MSLAPSMPVTSYFFPSASMTTALDAPRNGEKLDKHTPSSPMKKPFEDERSVPSARNVVNVNIDLYAFDAHLGFSACEKVLDSRSTNMNIRFFFIFGSIVLWHC